MAEQYVVNTKGLNLRSAPSSRSRENIIAVLHEGDIVEDLGATGYSAKWMHVRTVISGSAVEGYTASRFLTLKDRVPTVTVTHSLQGASYPENNDRITRSSGSRAFPLGETGRPTRKGNTPEERLASLQEIIDWLDVERSNRYRPGNGKTYCNIYAYDFCYLAGAYLPRVWWSEAAYCRLLHGKPVALNYPNLLEQNANALFNWLISHGELFGWKRLLDEHELQEEVNRGKVGVICAQRKRLNYSGHISVVVPEGNELEATRLEGRVVLPLQSQAGGKNRKYFTDFGDGKAWWRNGRYRDFGYWLHE